MRVLALCVCVYTIYSADTVVGVGALALWWRLAAIMVTPHITAQALHTTAHYRTSLYRHPRIGDALDMNRCLTFQPLRFVFTSQCVSRCVVASDLLLSLASCVFVCVLDQSPL